MYNISGIVYRIFAFALVILLLGVIVICMGKFWNKEKRKIKDIILGSGIIAFSIFLIIFYTYKAFNPTVKYHEGYLTSEYRDSTVAPPLPFTYAYVFSTNTGDKPIFYLDSFSKNVIFADDFSQDIKYRIYYEEDTHIILRVDEVS